MGVHTHTHMAVSRRPQFLTKWAAPQGFLGVQGKSVCLPQGEGSERAGGTHSAFSSPASHSVSSAHFLHQK